MKLNYLFVAGVLCYALNSDVHAQLPLKVPLLLQEKSLLFNNLPERFSINNLWLDHLFDGPDTGTVTIVFTGEKNFEGVILEKVQKNPHVVTINIKSSNYDGAFLTLSRVRYDDSSARYIGGLISINYGDVFTVSQDNNMVTFQRKKQSTVITE